MGRECQHAVHEVEWRETGQKVYLGIVESDPEMGTPVCIVGGACAVCGGETIDGGALDGDSRCWS